MIDAVKDTITVKTIENTNTPDDLRRPDNSWPWRRTMYFSVIWFCLIALSWIIFRRPISDPVILLYVKYSFWTMWIGLLMYGSQGTMSELAIVVSSFLSGRRTIETTAPQNAIVETKPTAQGTQSKVTSGSPDTTSSNSPSDGELAPELRVQRT